MIHVNEAVVIPKEELDWSYARSGGPGGQNVNKVSSKAILRWRAASTAAPIPLAAWQRMKSRYPGRFTTEGDVVLSSQRYRDQERNREDCAAKLAEMVRASLAVPTPRKKTRPSKAAKARRVEAKLRQSAKKQSRKLGGSDD